MASVDRDVNPVLTSIGYREFDMWRKIYVKHDLTVVENLMTCEGRYMCEARLTCYRELYDIWRQMFPGHNRRSALIDNGLQLQSVASQLFEIL